MNSSDPDKTLYAVWKDSFESGLSISYLQDMNSSICSSMPTATTTTGTYKLKDRRDNKIYTIAKMADGKCWMTQNLALNLSTSTTLTSSDTDLNTVSSFTPERNTIPTGSLSASTWSSAYYDPYSYNSGRTDYGIYYNWTAAIASNDSHSVTTKYQNAPNSICPKGWRLPKVYDGSSSNAPNEFGELLMSYGYVHYVQHQDGVNAIWANGGYNAVQQAPFSVTFPGRIANSSSFDGLGSGFNLWSSTYGYGNQPYALYLISDIIMPRGYQLSYRGQSVRCVLR